MSNSELEGSVILITGGTGSFGETMTRHLLKKSPSEIRIFSRDENKQDLMRTKYRDKRIKYFLGDVRDNRSIEKCMHGVDYVFHAAALKQVPSCEFFPMEAVATNVYGSDNVIRAALACKARSVVCLSTDKAVYPINSMGISKALMEKVVQSYCRTGENETRISITRYGNVMMSRGSVIPLFINQIMSNQPITITNPNMTRFLMSLDESVGLVDFAFAHANPGDIFVKKAEATSILNLAQGLIKALGKENEVRIQEIGTRHGEKLFESLMSTEESTVSEDLGEFYRIPLDSRTLDYQLYFDTGKKTSMSHAYTSHNAIQLSVDEVAEKIKRLPEFEEMTLKS